MHQMNEKHEAVVALLAKIIASQEKRVEGSNSGSNFDGRVLSVKSGKEDRLGGVEDVISSYEGDDLAEQKIPTLLLDATMSLIIGDIVAPKQALGSYELVRYAESHKAECVDTSSPSSVPESDPSKSASR
ncbi:Hypothetical predicted protein [Olea europaea subsp. europaea]|uniref:Uncharacterized protein n=1 Tax=Olea europaea subsp. europaea TaxID=158383 RepID=A0A8S0SBZ5_OLEEU|nr:Hypothetical predicted protein [Olea europaea subsp. europaea]